MTEPISSSESKGEGEAAPPGVPRWVKVSVIVVVGLLLAVVVVTALAGGEHGPGLHTGDVDGLRTLPSVTARIAVSG